MNTPRAGRGGRAFLAPIWTAVGAALLVGIVLLVVARLIVVHLAEPTTFVLVRHAEKSLEPVDDPLLTAAGEARALRLANMLGEPGEQSGPGRSVGASPVAVYASDTRRAQLTAGPLAERLGLQVARTPSGDPPEVVRELLRRHRGNTVVVVGHSNTVPELVAALTGGRTGPALAEDDFGSMFVVTVNRAGPAAVLRLRY